MTTEADPAATDALVRSAPFAGMVGLEIVAASPEVVHGRLDWRPELCTVAGVLHGGALITFADTLGSLCAFLNLEEGEVTSTMESKSNFFRAVREGSVDGVARPLHIGRSTIVVQTDLRDGKDRRVAQVTQTQTRLQAGG